MEQKLERSYIPKELELKKLVLTLSNKEYYGVHHGTLQLHLQLGMQLKHVHKVLQFKQRPFLKLNIVFNTECGKQSKTEFEKDFYQLLNCAFFGRFNHCIMCCFQNC